MRPNPLRVVLFAVAGLLIGILLLLLLMTRTTDAGILGIAMTLGVETIFFVLAVYVVEPTVAEDSPRNTTVPGPPPRKLYSRGWAIVLIGLAVLVASAVVSVFFDSYNLMLAQLVALQELRILTSRADLALQVTVGGYFALLFWLPAIFLTSFFVGSRAVDLKYWNCFAAVLISLGVFAIMNFVVELWAGELSIEILFSMMFNEGAHDTVRLPAEKGVFILVFAAILVVALLIISALVWIGARLGSRLRRRNS